MSTLCVGEVHVVDEPTEVKWGHGKPSVSVGYIRTTITSTINHTEIIIVEK